MLAHHKGGLSISSFLLDNLVAQSVFQRAFRLLAIRRLVSRRPGSNPALTRGRQLVSFWLKISSLYQSITINTTNMYIYIYIYIRRVKHIYIQMPIALLFSLIQIRCSVMLNVLHIISPLICFHSCEDPCCVWALVGLTHTWPHFMKTGNRNRDQFLTYISIEGT